MTFTFTNYAAIPPQHSPLNDIVSKVLGGYNEATKSKYLKPGLEADIFHKQISPLAMLASSPYFSSLHPEQQHQIAGYISQMLSKQGLGGNQNPMGQADGAQAPSGQASQVPGMPSPPIPGASNESLVPRNAAEHFTNKFGQSSYTPGAAHIGAHGETIYAPTGTNVQKGIDVLTESKGLKKLFDEYSAISPAVGGAGGINRDLSVIGSNIGKIGFPGSQHISEFLGGGKLAGEAAKMESLRAQMAPALRAIGFKDNEIDDLLKIHAGETEKNIKDRLKTTWPVIERKIQSNRKNLNQGINVNEIPSNDNEPIKSIDQKIARDKRERKLNSKISKAMNKGSYSQAPEGSIGLYRNGELYYIPAAEVNEALSAGFKYER